MKLLHEAIKVLLLKHVNTLLLKDEHAEKSGMDIKCGHFTLTI